MGEGPLIVCRPVLLDDVEDRDPRAVMDLGIATKDFADPL